MRATGDPRLDRARRRSARSRATGAVGARRCRGGSASVEIPRGTILLAHEISALAAHRPRRRASPGGHRLAAGGPTSHVAILAAVIGIPMLVAVGPKLLSIEASAHGARLDADAGTILRAWRARAGARRRRNSTRRGAAGRCARARGGTARLPHGERRAHRSVRESAGSVADAQLARGTGRRRLRSAAHRIPVPRPRHRAR